MYRETDRGLRYYIKEGDARVVSDRADAERQGDGDGRDDRSVVRLSAADFRDQLPRLRVRRPDSQLALLFAGVLAAGNIQRPKLGSTPLDASVDFFAIAAPSSDRLYEPAASDQPSAC